jgi:glycerol-3-phosphate dehydrogenase
VTASFQREEALARLRDEQFEVLVIGGGITGAGVALDAAARGLRTALVEGHDFASGTSSRSSKLVHGGLRYLQQREYRLVRENLVERRRLLANAPHLVRPLPFLVPVLGQAGSSTAARVRAYSTALWLYDVFGGLRAGTARHRRIATTEVCAHFPALRPELVRAGFIFHDAHADDARLTLAVVRTAVLDHGAVAANHARVAAILKDGAGRACGARLADGTEVRAVAVVNATGVWADDVRALDEGSHPHSLRPAKGIHLTVAREKLACHLATVLPVAADGRSIFVVPWSDRVYLGTTDTDYDGPLDDPQCTPADVAYVLDAVNAAVGQPLEEADVVGMWAGLRPLVASGGSSRTTDLSRRHRVATSASGVVTVTGGKLTTYRKMAADTVDVVVSRLGAGRAGASPTAGLALRGAAGTGQLEGRAAAGAARRLGTTPEGLAHLVARYGGETPAVLALAGEDDALAEPLVPGLAYLRAEAVYAARHEMATTVEDVLSRRTRCLLLDAAASAAAAPAVARLLAPELGWTPADEERQVSSFLATVARQREAAGLAVAGT